MDTISEYRPSPRSPRRLSPTAVLAPLVLLLASAGWTQDWSYRVRPGDNLWELAREYLRPDVGWQRLQEHNGISDPRAVQPGSTLHIPIAWLRIQPASARVVAVHGRVLGRRADGSEPFLVESDMALGIGVTLTTQEDSNLTLQFADGSRLLIQADTRVTLDTLSAYGRTGMVDTRMRLQRGRASSQVIDETGPGSRFVVDTPAATTSVRGTQFRLATRDGGEGLLVEVIAGSVNVRDGDGEVAVPAGAGTRVAVRGGAPLAPVPLLPAPELDEPPATLNRLPLELAWSALAGATGYRVQIAPDRWFTTLLHDAIVDEPRASIAALPDGSFVVRVRGIDRHGIEGMDAQRTFLLDAHPQPPFAVAPREGDIVREPRPRFAWTSSPSAAAYRFQLARDPGFEDRVLDLSGIAGTGVRPADALAAGDYYWRVGARAAGGELGPFGDALRFTVRPRRPSPKIAPPTVRAGRMTFRWQAAPPGHRYRFQLARRADFAAPLIDRLVDEPEITVSRPRRGTWYMRVRTVDANGRAGPYGETQTIDLPCRACQVATAAVVVIILLAL